MLNIKLIISYNGTQYFGSQIQPDQITIQSVLEDIFKIINIDTTLEFSGRTDKGVHAFKQVISCKIPSFWDSLEKLKDTLNRMLPSSIKVRYITKVEDSFHARFSAKSREYRYIFSTKEQSVFSADFISYFPNLDIQKIYDTLPYFIGVYDFEYFSKKGSDPVSTVREIYNIRFYKHKDIYVLNFVANSYLRSQIRMMVDFIIKISQGKLSIDDLKKQLIKEKKISWTLAPSNGLYLSTVSY